VKITRLLGNRVLLEPMPMPDKSAGGIHLVESYRRDEKLYRVLAVGPGKLFKKGTMLGSSKLKKDTFIKPEVQVGQCVLGELYEDHFIMPDGKRIAEADRLLAVW